MFEMRNSIHSYYLSYVLPLAFASFSMAEGTDNSIVGCDAVGCPKNNTCTISNDTLSTGIGVAPIVSDNTSFPSLSWVKGSYLDDSQAPANAVYVDNFYLATPQGQSLGSDGAPACALFFRKFNAAFPGPIGETADATGTCPDAIQQSCIDALTKRATGLDVANETDACGALQQDFESNMDSECSQYAFGEQWESLNAECKVNVPLSKPHSLVDADSRPSTRPSFDQRPAHLRDTECIIELLAYPAKNR